MSIHEIEFPIGIDYGSKGGPGFRTKILEADGGHEVRISPRESERRRFNAGAHVRDVDDIKSIYSFFLARKGALHGFRYKDLFDFTSAANGLTAPYTEDQRIGTGDGSTTTFQLIKTYSDSKGDHIRNIQKIVAGTVIVAIDSIPQATGWSVNHNSGIITFTTAPGAGAVICAGFEFRVPVRFDEASDEWFEMAHRAFQLGDIPEIMLVELPDETPIDENYNYRGSEEYPSMAASVSITCNDGYFHYFQPAASGLAALLPSTDTLAYGGAYFSMANEGSYTMELQTDLGVKICDLPVGECFIILLAKIGGSKVWYVIQ